MPAAQTCSPLGVGVGRGSSRPGASRPGRPGAARPGSPGSPRGARAAAGMAAGSAGTWGAQQGQGPRPPRAPTPPAGAWTALRPQPRRETWLQGHQGPPSCRAAGRRGEEGTGPQQWRPSSTGRPDYQVWVGPRAGTTPWALRPRGGGVGAGAGLTRARPARPSCAASPAPPPRAPAARAVAGAGGPCGRTGGASASRPPRGLVGAPGGSETTPHPRRSGRTGARGRPRAGLPELRDGGGTKGGGAAAAILGPRLQRRSQNGRPSSSTKWPPHKMADSQNGRLTKWPPQAPNPPRGPSCWEVREPLTDMERPNSPGKAGGEPCQRTRGCAHPSSRPRLPSSVRTQVHQTRGLPSALTFNERMQSLPGAGPQAEPLPAPREDGNDSASPHTGRAHPGQVLQGGPGPPRLPVCPAAFLSTPLTAPS